MHWVIIQSRSGSVRLPRKCTKVLHGKYLIQSVYDRCRVASDNVIVAIPDNDDWYELVLDRECIPFFKGHPTDLITRYLECAHEYGITKMARITGDCPFIPPEYITHSFYLMEKYNADMVSNCIDPCIDGAEVDVFNIKALEWMDENTEDPYREHVTQWLKLNPDYSGLKICSWGNTFDDPNIGSYSIDTTGDLERCRKMSINNTGRIL